MSNYQEQEAVRRLLAEMGIKMPRARKPRRKRFTYVLADGQPHAILAYDAASVKSYLERRGNTVVSITEGDHRINAMKGGWSLDQAAFKAAQRQLSLTLPVKLRRHAREGGTNGNYRFKGTYHEIMIKDYLSADWASQALWHELTHAQQAEKAGTKEAWSKLVRTNKRIYGYKRSPHEVEARAMADKMKDAKLARPL